MPNTPPYDMPVDVNTKSDAEFFKLYAEAADIVFNNGEEQVVFIKDKDFNFYYFSPAYTKQVAPNAFYSLNDESITEDMRNTYDYLEEKANKQDSQMKEKKQAANFIYIDVYNRIGFVHKRPIVNPATGNFVGIIGVAKPFELPNILSLIYKMHGINFGLANKTHKEPLKYELTERQAMVLFLYLNKYSNAEIAEIMTIVGYKISKSRVNDHLENLKYIFQIKTKEQLIEKAISMNYHLLIPREFLQIGSFEIEDEVLIIN